jgi:hypothetical protein
MPREKPWSLREKQLGTGEMPWNARYKAGSPGEMPVVPIKKPATIGKMTGRGSEQAGSPGNIKPGN